MGARREWRVIDISEGTVTKPLAQEWHARGKRAFVIHDCVTNSLVLTQKLTAAADYLNDNCARNHRERVSARGLYEAAGKVGGYNGGYHKLRYLVTPCSLETAHLDLLQKTRDLGVCKARILTSTT